jgi:hypothetical protein
VSARTRSACARSGVQAIAPIGQAIIAFAKTERPAFSKLKVLGIPRQFFRKDHLVEDRSVVLALQSIQETVDIGPRDAVAMACLIAYRRGSLLRTSRLVVSEFVAHDSLPGSGA